MPAQQTRQVYIAAEVRGDRFVARRCVECGEWATTNGAWDSGRHDVQGRLPERCRVQHGNATIEVPLVVAETGKEQRDA